MRVSLFLLAAVIGAATAQQKCNINDPTHLCCKPDGSLYGKSRLCRPACDVCDSPEYCDSVNPTCPPDKFAKDIVCRPAVSVCDKPEKCDGSGVKCPTDTFWQKSDNVQCRQKLGACDSEENNICAGSLLCPEPKFLPSGTQCSVQSTDNRVSKCDPVEVCPGSSPYCPTDKKLSNCPCKPTDVAEFTSLFSTAYPEAVALVAKSNSIDLPCGEYVCDSKNGCSIVPKAEGTPCAGEDNECAAASFCTGQSFSCPARVKPAGTVCRASKGPCDTAEVCDGTLATCPGEDWSLAGKVCRPAYGTCDKEDVCVSGQAQCPDVKLTGVCRPAAGPCDKEEMCDGRRNECPRDSFHGVEWPCRDAARGDECDIADFCSGTGPICYDSRYSNCGSQQDRPLANAPVLLVEAL